MTEMNKYGLSRYIDAPTERQVRQACGYGCVVCGDAIFQYEHIDPEFAEAREHDPACIAALCGACHDKVTRGFWSKDKVKQARQGPFCRQKGFSHTPLDISGKGGLVVKIGNTEFVNLQTIIEIDGESILSVDPPEESNAPPRISAKFYDQNNKEVASIVQNVWRGSADAFDIEAKGGTFKIQSDERQVDLLIDLVPPNLFVIERINLAYNDARISGDISKGFKVEIPGASLQVPADPRRIQRPPFWLSIRDGRIALGSDCVGKYNREDCIGYYEIHNADVEIVSPAEIPSRSGTDVLKITGREGGGRVDMVFLDLVTKRPARRDGRAEFGRKVNRNELCPCGSGKKHKYCHGKSP